MFNFTLVDYIQGEKKKNRDHCEVLGYWGDITLSPFWTFGLTVDNHDEFKEFFKITNDKYYFYNEKFSEHFIEKIISSFPNKEELKKINIEVSL